MCPVRVDTLGSIVNQDKENGRHWIHQAITPSRRSGSTKLEDEEEKMFGSEANTMIADT